MIQEDDIEILPFGCSLNRQPCVQFSEAQGCFSKEPRGLNKHLKDLV